MELSRISALLEPFVERPLASAQLEQISTYIDLLLRWNARINLTAVRDPDAIVTRHFGESFFLARHLFEMNSTEPVSESGIREKEGAPAGAAKESQPAAPPRVIDIGSGAGFPALPLKIWAPRIDLTLIESNYKKTAFLREVSRSLTLTNVNVITERAETLADRLPPAALVTFRAVESFETIAPLATRFVAPAGRLALLIGAAQFPSLRRLAPNLSWPPAIPIAKSESRVLAISQRNV